jgi:hypothetical protein
LEKLQGSKENNDRFSQLMFGKKAAPKEQEEQEADTENLISDINYEQLMENVDILMNVYEQIKPGLSKLNPLLLKWIKKA